MPMQFVSKKRLLFISSNRCLFYYKGCLYHSAIPENKDTKLCSLATSIIERVLFYFPFAERALRLAPKCCAKISDSQIILARRGHIWKVDLKTGRLSKEFTFPQGMSGPIYLVSIRGVTGFPDGIYCGTYVGFHQPVRIWHRSVEGVWSEVFEFPDGEVLHIHNIVPDPTKHRILILTGDRDDESAIWEATDFFAVVRPLLKGSQQYRACVAFPVDDHIFYATDTPLEQNYIYDFDERSGRVTIVRQMPGPVIYGTTIDQTVFRTMRWRPL